MSNLILFVQATAVVTGAILLISCGVGYLTCRAHQASPVLGQEGMRIKPSERDASRTATPYNGGGRFHLFPLSKV